MGRILWMGPLGLALTLTVTACAGGGGGGATIPTPTRPAGTPSGAVTPAPRPSPVPYQPPHDRPGPAVDRVSYRSFFVDQAPLDFQAGKMDFYLFSLKTAAAREIRSKPGVRLDEAPATTVSIILNPAPAPESELNPFSIKAIRQAVQYLVNRDFVANDIYQGMALPMVTHLSPTDFDFLTVYDQVRASDIRYDPELARSVIQREMARAGAEAVDGKWRYRGRPIRLKFIIRVEDERRTIGDLVTRELERAGFEVSPSFRPFAEAVQGVYSTDPQSFGWHLYTEGWGRGSPSRYDFATINGMAAPWQGNMPGWREVGFWQYEQPELDTLGQRLFTGEFQDADDRARIYRRMTELALDESVRIWVATVQNSFPLNQNLRGVTDDLVSGPKSPRTVREAYVPGKSELTLGHLWVWTERTTWNPVGGFGDIYSSDIFASLYDPPIWNHPFTGLPVPYRAKFQVETAGPRGKLAVPQDAVRWDAADDRWKAVGSGVQATSKVVFDYSGYFNTKWHHGQSITMADVIYSIAQGYEIAYDPQKSRVEFALGVTSRPYLNTFRGYRIRDNNTLEVYVDYWHFEPSQIASYASPSGVSTPWELLAAMDSLVFEQRPRAAYSDTAAGRYNVPWLSLVVKRDAGLVERRIRELASRGFVPEGYFTVGNTALVSPQEAVARYQAALAWFDKYGLLVISNGPFFLARYEIEAQFAEIQAFRDPSYPFRPGNWYLGPAPALQVRDIRKPALSPGRPAEVAVTVEGAGRLGLRYTLVDAAARKVVKSGEAERQGPGFVVRLDAQATGGLQPGGLYTLFVAAYSDEIAAITERKIDLDVTR